MPLGLLAALDVSGKINQFGAYAGLAAIIGLGVLSVLYFGQAREIRRLRDWAGRAPERAAEAEAAVAQSAQARMAAHPQANAPVAPRPAPAAASTAAAAAASGVRPGVTPASTPLTATGAPVTAPGTPAPVGPAAAAAAATAAAAKAATTASPSAAGQPTVVIPPTTPGTPAAPGTPPSAGAPPAAGTPPKPATPAPATPAAAQPPTQAPVAPTPRPAPAAPLRAPTPAAYTPSTARAQASAERELGVQERSPLRSTLMIVGGVIAVAVLVFVLVTQVFGGSDSSTKPNRVASDGGTSSAAKTTPRTTKSVPTVARGNVTVAFLNGTRVTGVARGAANKVQAGGYKIGAVTNAVDQTAQTTIVYFADGQRAQAVQVASLLGLPSSSVQPLDQSTRVVAGPDADVVVVVGADQSGA